MSFDLYVCDLGDRSDNEVVDVLFDDSRRGEELSSALAAFVAELEAAIPVSMTIRTAHRGRHGRRPATLSPTDGVAPARV